MIFTYFKEIFLRTFDLEKEKGRTKRKEKMNVGKRYLNERNKKMKTNQTVIMGEDKKKRKNTRKIERKHKENLHIKEVNSLKAKAIKKKKNWTATVFEHSMRIELIKWIITHDFLPNQANKLVRLLILFFYILGGSVINEIGSKSFVKEFVFHWVPHCAVLVPTNATLTKED